MVDLIIIFMIFFVLFGITAAICFVVNFFSKLIFNKDLLSGD